MRLLLSLLVARYHSSLLYPVGYEPLNPGLIARVQGYGLIIKAFNSLRFTAAQMALTTLCPHNFAGTGDVKAAFCPFMGFKLWHLGLLLPLLWR